MMIKVTDEITGKTATVEISDVAATIRPWYPDAPAEVLEAIEQLQASIDRDDSLHGLEEYLAINVERI